MAVSKPLMQTFKHAVSLSSGYGIGPLRFLSTVDKLLAADIPDSNDHGAVIDEAFTKVSLDLTDAMESFDEGTEQNEFFQLQLIVLGSLKKKLLAKTLSADGSEDSYYQHLKRYYENLIGNRQADNMRPIALRLMSAMADIPFDDLSSIQEGDIVFATALTLKQASDLMDKNVGGIITCNDPADGHLRAIALQHGIPCITGISSDGFVRTENDEHTAIIDTAKALLIIDPNTRTLKKYHSLKKAEAKHREEQESHALEPCQTKDGTYISLLANVNDLNFERTKKFPVDGIGLVRLEMIFAKHAAPIGSHDQTRMFEDAFTKLGSDRPVTVRVLDVNVADKHPDQILHGSQRELVKGAGELEGLDFLMKNPALLTSQYRSLIETSIQHPVKVLLPAVRSLEQLNAARRMFVGVYNDMLADDSVLPGTDLPPLGTMIETAEIVSNPSSLRKVIKRSDFISVGTNDLTHEMAATDRFAEKPTGKHQDIQYNPRFIKTLKQISEMCLADNKEMSMCGNLASDAEFLPLVLALRMKPVVLTEQIYDIRERIAQLDLNECDALLERVSKMGSAPEIRTEVQKFNALVLARQNDSQPVAAVN